MVIAVVIRIDQYPARTCLTNALFEIALILYSAAKAISSALDASAPWLAPKVAVVIPEPNEVDPMELYVKQSRYFDNGAEEEDSEDFDDDLYDLEEISGGGDRTESACLIVQISQSNSVPGIWDPTHSSAQTCSNYR